MVPRQPVSHAPAAIVSGEREAGITERLHDFYLVLRHRPFGIVNVRRAAFRLAGIPIATKIGTNNGKALRQARSDLAPHRVRLRIAVQEQERRTAAAGDQVDLRARSADATRIET